MERNDNNADDQQQQLVARFDDVAIRISDDNGGAHDATARAPTPTVAAAVDAPSPTTTRKPTQQKPTQQQQKQKQKQKQQTPAPLPPQLELDGLFDFDCNLTHDDLVDDADGLMHRATAAGVTEMLVPGATLVESHAALALCRQHPDRLFATAGVHPFNAHTLPTPNELAALTHLATLDDCLAVGECGLDYSPHFPAPASQRSWFSAQLDIAIALNKPLFLHERLAYSDFVAAIDACMERHSAPLPPAVVHCFTGSAAELQAYVDRGFYIGITGHICKPTHGAALRDLVARVPLERLVIETDAPYMGFKRCRHREAKDAKAQYPNVPSALPLVAAAVAAAIGKTPQDVAALTRANARRFLQLTT